MYLRGKYKKIVFAFKKKEKRKMQNQCFHSISTENIQIFNVVLTFGQEAPDSTLEELDVIRNKINIQNAKTADTKGLYTASEKSTKSLFCQEEILKGYKICSVLDLKRSDFCGEETAP